MENRMRAVETELAIRESRIDELERIHNELQITQTQYATSAQAPVPKPLSPAALGISEDATLAEKYRKLQEEYAKLQTEFNEWIQLTQSETQ
jgi:hypothetical protein